jgi:hypothetical protein
MITSIVEVAAGRTVVTRVSDAPGTLVVVALGRGFWVWVRVW